MAPSARLALALAAGICACHRETESARTPTFDESLRTKSFNQRVLALIDEYPAKGVGGYVWPAAPGTAGTTRDLRIGDAVIAKAGEGTHCVGITLEVFWRALEQCEGGVARAFDVDTATDFKRRWYVPELGGRGAADALPAHHLGAQVPLAEARPGDFVQAWGPDGTFGHSMVFLGADAGEIRYWSSQPWTEGIDRSQSPLGDGGFAPDRIYVARASCP
jgi:hypothetical protein